jgi:hypothetical protein
MSTSRIGRRGLICLAGAALLVIATPGIGYAFWPASSSGQSARATADTLPTGFTPSTVTAVAKTVTITFGRASTSAASGSVTITNYLMKRYPTGAPANASATASFGCVSAAGSSATCTESTTPDGSWVYSDTPVIGNWVGSESARSGAVSVDTTGPAVSITAPSNGGATNDTTPTISGTAGVAITDLAAMTIRIYAGQGTGGTLLQTKSATAVGGSWTVDANALAANATFTVQARQSDSSANVGVATSTFVVDTLAPSVTLTAPVAAGTVGPTPTFAGTASSTVASASTSADSGTVMVNIYSGGTATGTPVQSLTPSVGSGSYSVVANALASGQYTARSTQSDAAGNATNSNTKTFTVDATAPAVSITSPANGATNDLTPTLAGAAGNSTGDLTTVSVKLYAGGSATGTPIQTFTPARSGATWTVTATTLTANAQYTVQASQSDSLGNLGIATSTFVLDRVAPANVTVTAPAAGSVNPATPTITGTAGSTTGSTTTSADQSTVTVVIYQGSGTGGDVAQTLLANVVGGSYTVNANTLSSGTYTVQTNQLDAAGNSTASNTRTFTVDGTPPTVTVSSIADTKDTTPSFSGTSTSGDLPTITVRIHAGGSPAGAVLQTLTTTKSLSAWSVTPTTPLAGNAQYTVQASQVDAAGNVGLSTARTFVLDTTAPSGVAITAPTAGQTGVGRGPTFSGTAGFVVASSTATDDDGTVTLTLYNGVGTGGGVKLTRTPSVGASGNWSVKLSNNTLSSSTTYTAVISQADAAGNTTISGAITFTT